MKTRPMSLATGQKPGRKFPPPCWTRDEALVLIEAYRERWHALHRAFLRTPDWDAVAEKVTTSCPDVTPPKTSAQCRHKMEKLRQRHRVEKQRASEFSGEQFFSTWFYFEAMEAMENGSSSEPGNKDLVISQTHLNPGRGIRFKPSQVQKIETLTKPTNYNKRRNPNLDSRVSNRYSYEDGSLVETLIEEPLIPITHRGTSNSKHGYLVETPFMETKNRKNSEIRIKPSISVQTEPVRESVRPGLRPRKFSKVLCDDDEEDEDDEMWVKVPRNVNSVKGKYENVNNSIPYGKGLNKGKEKPNGGISEMVASIKLLGDGFLKVEKMKMDMAKEIEKMRMESEMKRNQLMLESQKQIIDAFVKGLIESRKETTTMGNL